MGSFNVFGKLLIEVDIDIDDVSSEEQAIEKIKEILKYDYGLSDNIEFKFDLNAIEYRD